MRISRKGVFDGFARRWWSDQSNSFASRSDCVPSMTVAFEVFFLLEDLIVLKIDWKEQDILLPKIKRR